MFYESWGPRTGFSFVLFIDVLTKPYKPLFFYLMKTFLNVFYWPVLSVVQRSKHYMQD
jgi:hypothetical protein